MGICAAAWAASTPNLSKIILRAGQVGAGYTLQMRSDSHDLANAVTLDMCGFDFKSEALRTARLQVNYSRSGSAVKLSNEVVTYRAGGAAQAMAEIDRAVAGCPNKPEPSRIAGVPPLTYKLTKFATHGLLPGAIGLDVRISGKLNGRPRTITQVAVYQTHGNVLSGVYSTGGAVAAQRRLALHAAAGSAANLRAS